MLPTIILLYKFYVL